MRITLKLYASLGRYLPSGAVRHAAPVDVPDDASANWVIDRFGVPREEAHLVLVNGLYVDRDRRDRNGLRDGDTLAIWPPVAGG
jgi:sulfur carrier protein ThiS